MVKKLCLIISFLLFLGILPLQAADLHRVLYVSAYHPAFPTFFQQVEGIRSVFSGHKIHLDIEFMDTKRFPGRQTVEAFYVTLKQKLSDVAPYDAILVADDNALSFALEYQQQLFQEKPVIFLGVNNIDLALEQNDNRYITGVVEAVSMRETIDLMRRLHPQSKRIVALVDSLPSGQADLKKYYQYQDDFPGIEFSELSLAELDFDSFAGRLRELSDNDMLLLLSAYRDRSAKTLLFHDSLELIKANSSRPLYHLWQHGLGEGVLGGKLISHRQQGIAAAEMALEILAGTPAESLLVSSSSPNSYLFDYNELERFGVDRSALPAGTTIINEPQSYYRQNKTAIWAVTAIFVGYSILLFMMYRSIRKRKRAEGALRFSENRLKELIEQSPIGLALFTRDGAFVSINPAYSRIVGYSGDELLKLTNWDITPDEYIKRDKSLLQRLKVGGHYGPYEKKYRHKDGRLVSARLNVMHLVINEENLIWASVEDITALKEAEAEKQELAEQLRQSQKMEAIGTLAGGVAHDFNNILSGILGFTELALANPNCDPKNHQHLELVLNAARRAGDLVNQILMFSRKNDERQTFVDVYSIVAEATTLMRKTIPATVEIKRVLDKETGTVLANSTQLHQVVMNLCTNAYHALEDLSGTIDIGLEAVDVDAAMAAQYSNLKQGHYALLTVADTGCGIDPDIIERIFEPFFTTKQQGEGTGMGLAVVHGILQTHGGAIGVDSKVGEGTTVRVFLPLREKDLQPVLSADSSAGLGGSEHLMMIDDEEMLVALGRETFEALGYRVTTFSTAREALDAFGSNPEAYDLVVTDQSMPEMTGDVLAEQMLTIRPDIPIVLCTGYSSRIDNEDQARAIGVRALFMKPVELEALAKTVRQLLDETKLS